MSSLLQQWVCTRLGIKIELDPENLGEQFFDGKLFFKLLHSYNVVNPRFGVYFCEATTPDVALKNLKLMCVWFKLLGILHNEDLLREISEKKGSACLKLLNALYVALSNRHTLPLVGKKTEERVLAEGGDSGDFIKSKVRELPCLAQDLEDPLAKPIKDLQPLIAEYKERHAALVKRSRAESEHRERVLTQARESTHKCVLEFKDPLQEIADFEASLSKLPRTPMCSPEDYLKTLREKNRKHLMEQEILAEIKTKLMKEAWCSVVKKQELDFDCAFSEKLIRQSQYERQISLRLGQIQDHYKLFIESRRAAFEVAEEKHLSLLESARAEEEDSYLNNKCFEEERDRLLELHRVLYAEKKRALYERHYNFCQDVVSDLADFAVSVAEYERINLQPIPTKKKNEWKALFYKGIKISDSFETLSVKYRRSTKTTTLYAIDDLTVISRSSRGGSTKSGSVKFELQSIEQTSGSEVHTEAEEDSTQSLIKLDIEEDVINEQNLEDYLLLLGPWMKESWPELAEFEEDLRVLGYAVHRVLETKYPTPGPAMPAQIPQYPTRCLLSNLTDEKVIDKLRALLSKPGIAVIDIKSAVNYCTAQYKKEVSLVGPPKLSLPNKDEKAKSKSKKSLLKAELSKKKKIKEESAKAKDVETQYPSQTDLTDLELQLSEAGMLGKEAYELLNVGQPLTESLNVRLLVEYIKVLDCPNGWVLINYPMTCSQISILEYIFSGLEPPLRCDVLDEVKLFIEETKPKPVAEDLDSLKTSRILPRPNPVPKNSEFYSYFSQFIELKPLGKAVDKSKSVVENLKMPVYSDDEEDEVEPDDTPAKELTPPKFYENYNLFLPFEYASFEPKVILSLARLILNEQNDIGPSRRTSEELFGEDALRLLGSKKVTIDKKKSVGKGSKATSKSSVSTVKKRTKSKQSGLIEIEETKLDEEIVVDKAESETKLSVENMAVCEVGEPCWRFTEFPLPEDFQVTLASIWESVELTYLDNLKMTFSLYRDNDSLLIPFRNYVLDEMMETIEAPDKREDLVKKMQFKLNGIADRLRILPETKNELFCEIFELQNRLWELCDEKKMKSENKRIEIINQNWFVYFTCILANVSVCLLQWELDRYIDSIQFLADYYTVCLDKTPSKSHLNKFSIPKFSFSEQDRDSFVSEGSLKKSKKSSSISSESKEKSRSSKIKGISNEVAKILIDPDVDPDLMVPYFGLFGNLVDLVITNIQSITAETLNLVSDEKNIYLPPNKPKKSTGDKGKKASAKNKSVIEEVEPSERRENLTRLFREWKTGVTKESDRAVFRVNLIKARFETDLVEAQRVVQGVFHRLHAEISGRYQKQLASVDSVVRVLKIAVEEGSTIGPALVLTLDGFFANPNEAPIPDPPPPSPLMEPCPEFTFTIQQLYHLMYKMAFVSPTGIIQEPFVQILADMAYQGLDTGYPYLPSGWAQLSHEDIRYVLKSIYGDVVFLDWKDFIILALNIRFPTLKEIISLREEFLLYDPDMNETINISDYSNIRFWFEKDMQPTLADDLRIVLTKQLLFCLFQVDNDATNYTSMLLGFCKDENPVEGFGKALSLKKGVGYILSKDQLYLLEKGESAKESEIIAGQIMNIILAKTMLFAEGVVVSEYDEYGNKLIDDDDFDIRPVEEGPPKVCSSESKDIISKVVPKLNNNASDAAGDFVADEGVTEEEIVGAEEEVVVLDNILGVEEMSEESTETQPEPEVIIWDQWLSYDMVKPLLETSFQYYALSPDHASLREELEIGLCAVFKEHSVCGYINGHVLVNTPYMKHLFSFNHKFQSCNLQTLVMRLLESKGSVKK